MEWNKIKCSKQDLNLDLTLQSGQAFRWKKHDGVWGSVQFSHVVELKQDDSFLYFRAVDAPKTDLTEEIIDYFQLKIDLPSLYEKWSANDKYFKKVANNMPGMRLLRQNPIECLFSFICSSNNNIVRISSMVSNMATNFGTPVQSEHFNFPTIEALADDKVEEKLRKLKFGYRAKFIPGAAKKVLEYGGTDWLYSLRSIPHLEARQLLSSLPGVGNKVADCVCLMSLDKLQVVPVDTHVWQFTSAHYLASLKSVKSMNNTVYNKIGLFYQQLWGDTAGWAHTILFTAELNLKSPEDNTNQKTKRRKVEDKKSD